MTAPQPVRQTTQDELVCRDLVELVTDYLDGLLEPTTAAAVEQHLALCPACVRYVMQMLETTRLLGHLPVGTLSAQAKAEILAAFHHFRRP